MPSQSTNVFVSYSHSDASLVAPVVRLLRVNKSLIFHDEDCIQPGRRWRSEISNGLSDSDLVVVFWCDHANRSEEVSKEWKAAIEQKKDLLPLLLDATPLPPELGEFQWIDFRGTVGANHGAIVTPPSDAKESAPHRGAPLKSGRWLLFATLVPIFAAIALGFFASQYDPLISPTITVPQQDGGNPIDSKTFELPPMAAPPPVQMSEYEGRLSRSNILLSMTLILAAVASIAWSLRRYLKRRKPTQSVTPHAPEIERRIAREIEAEVLRRAVLKRDAVE